jgi:apolipoprotein D and lipocalin family protein
MRVSFVVSFLTLITLGGCSSMGYKKTVNKVDIDKFMGKWYVIAARGTYFESDAYNSVEVYSWNEKEDRIDIDFTYRDGSFDGKLKDIPQKAWIEIKRLMLIGRCHHFGH